MPLSSRSLLETNRFRVVELTESSSSNPPIRRAVVRHPGAVVILPALEDDRVCLIRNWRVAVERTLLELPAGTREPGEAPEVTAERELAEETGYRAARLERLHTFYSAPGILDEQMHLYLATGLTPGPAHREVGERMENHVVSWDEALRLVDDGTVEDAKTIAGLLLYERLVRGRR